jgi:putative restriction endonuclease
MKMTVRLVVAVTDGEWFNQLCQIPNLSEVNFWSPSASTFKALQSGELFLFKLHSPNNFIVGGGVFTHANSMPCSLAWEVFRESNGARSLIEMRSRITKYRRVAPDERDDFIIGCRILSQPFFFDRARWLPAPKSFALTTVTFKTYSTEDDDGRRLWEAVADSLPVDKAPQEVDSPSNFADIEQAEYGDQQSKYGEPVLVRPRLGQGAFRILVTDNYERRCAISGEKTLPALDAAHIRPFADGGSHRVSNGILLRRDIHSLFDLGYVTISPDLRFEVSRKIREEYENGRYYYSLHGNQIRVPGDPKRQPSQLALAWHNDHLFKG